MTIRLTSTMERKPPPEMRGSSSLSPSGWNPDTIVARTAGSSICWVKRHSRKLSPALKAMTAFTSHFIMQKTRITMAGTAVYQGRANILGNSAIRASVPEALLPPFPSTRYRRQVRKNGRIQEINIRLILS